MAKLLKLNQQVQTCRLCRLCRSRMNGVPGEGDENAAIMFIGEGPGFNEDREGRPFVGQAGQFLEELLACAGLRREQVYITNVVKCRPPQNRDPLPDEIEACAPYLERQMALIGPLVIVTLGRYSMMRFFPNDRITAVAGQARYAEGRMVVTMLHPAYALRNTEAKEQMRDAFRRLPAIVERARQDRSNEAAQPAPTAVDDAAFEAVVEQHLNEIEQRLRENAPAAPAPAAEPTPADPFAYTSAVNGARKAAKAARPAPAASSADAAPETLPAEATSEPKRRAKKAVPAAETAVAASAPEPVVEAALDVAVAPEPQAAVALEPEMMPVAVTPVVIAPLEEAAPGTIAAEIRPVEETALVIAPLVEAAPIIEEQMVAPEEAAQELPTEAPAATKGRKKSKPEPPEAVQLSLF